MNIQEYNAQIIREYLINKKVVPKNTYRSISADCKVIEKYLSDNNAMITSLPGTTFAEQFVSSLTENSTPATIKRRLCTLRSIIHWCQEQGYILRDHDIDIFVNLEIPKPHYASNEDIAKLYSFCRHIVESDEYIMARAKLECLMVIICGFKVSELKKLRIQDVTSPIIEDRMKMVRCTKSECIDVFLKLRADFTDSWLIKSDILFVNKYGNENEQINLDYELIREQCKVNGSVTLSSIRNSCIKEYSILLNNDAVTAKLFDVTVQWLDKMKKQAEHDKYWITDDEMMMLTEYRKLSPKQQEEIYMLLKTYSVM